MKLRVVELLLVTTLPALFLAADGIPALDITLATLIAELSPQALQMHLIWLLKAISIKSCRELQSAP